jgi:hypothetical protein
MISSLRWLRVTQQAESDAVTSETDTESLINFTVRLNEEDWETSRKAWRCPSLAIPSATIQDIFVGGDRVDKSNYQILKGPSAIRWIPANPPMQIAVEIQLGEVLSRQSDTGYWKKLAIVLPVAATVLVALISAITTYLIAPHPEAINIADLITARVSEVNVDPKNFTYRLAADPFDLSHYIKKSEKEKYNLIVGIRLKSAVPDIQGQYENAFGVYGFEGTNTQAPEISDGLRKAAETGRIIFALFRVSQAGLAILPFKTPFEPKNYGAELKILDTKFEGNCP